MQIINWAETAVYGILDLITGSARNPSLTYDKPRPASERDIFRNISSSAHTHTHTPLQKAHGV